MIGSSPRVWGILLLEEIYEEIGRFIPTCVGNSRTHFAIFSHSAVHPHVCGEFSITFLQMCSFPGSSPRVWGIPQYKYTLCWIFRFIPTCVGNSIGPIEARRFTSVHPHVCGEFLSTPLPSSSNAGSSPRVWGIQGHSVRRRWCCRFIPTCVGNSLKSAPVHTQFPVHPHVCGEFGLKVLY